MVTCLHSEGVKAGRKASEAFPAHALFMLLLHTGMQRSVKDHVYLHCLWPFDLKLTC